MERITQARNTSANLFTYLQRGKEEVWECVLACVMCLCLCMWILTSPPQTPPAPSAAGSMCHRHACCWALLHLRLHWRLLLSERCTSGGEKWAHVSSLCSRINIAELLFVLSCNIPARSLWFPVCTWIQRRLFRGRNRDPLLPQTLDPKIWRSCSMSHQLVRNKSWLDFYQIH